MKKPFETKFAIEVTEVNFAEIQRRLFTIGCKWYGGHSEVKEGKYVTEICVTVLGTLTLNVKGVVINYPVFSIEEAERQAQRLAENRIKSLESKLEKTKEAFLTAVDKYNKDISTAKQKLIEIKKLIEQRLN